MQYCQSGTLKSIYSHECLQKKLKINKLRISVRLEKEKPNQTKEYRRKQPIKVSAKITNEKQACNREDQQSYLGK